MTTAKDIRCAHELLDELDARAELSQEQEKLLRSFLPELPKDATLVDLLDRVHAAWLSANASDWGFDTPAEHHDWLFDLRNDLVHIIEEQDAPAAVPALPAGMRLAEHDEYGRVVVSPKADKDGDYLVFIVDESFTTGGKSVWARSDELTFIESEPAKPAHPEFLETEADYHNAPAGTVVAEDGLATSWIKRVDIWASTDGGRGVRCPILSYGPRRVLRWGK